MGFDLSLFFPKTIYKANTENGELTIVKEGSRLRVIVGGVTQSVNDTNLIKKNGYWQGYLNLKQPPERALILGYGAGTADALLREKYPSVEVVGIEVEPIIASEARQRLFPDLDSPVYIQTAQAFLAESIERYDLILCDIFRADRVDDSVFDDTFWGSIQDHLTPDGTVVVNRILQKGNDQEYNEFEKVLDNRFEIVDVLKIRNPTRRFNCLFYLHSKQ